MSTISTKRALFIGILIGLFLASGAYVARKLYHRHARTNRTEPYKQMEKAAIAIVPKNVSQKSKEISVSALKGSVVAPEISVVVPESSVVAPESPELKYRLGFEKISDLEQLKTIGLSNLVLTNAHTHEGFQSLKVSFEEDAESSGWEWNVQEKDWSLGNVISLMVFNPNDTNVTIDVTVKTGGDNKSVSESLVLASWLKTSLEITMSDEGNISWNDVRSIEVIVRDAKKDMELYFDDVGVDIKEGAMVVKAVMPEAVADSTVSLKNLPEGYKLFTATSLDRIFKDGNTVSKPDFSQSVKISAARNEYESAQIVISNGRDTLRNVRLELSDLTHENASSKISQETLSWRIVRYVPTVKPYYPVKFVGDWPDPLMTEEYTHIAPGVTQPFWFTVKVPEDAEAGLYKGSAKVRIGQEEPVSVDIELEVYGFTLPRESTLKTSLGFYDHVTHMRYPQGSSESKDAYDVRIEELNKEFINTMLEYRMNPILNVDVSKKDAFQTLDNYRWKGLNNFAIGKKGGTFTNNWPKEDEKLEELLPVYRQYGELLALNKMLNMHYVYTWDEAGDMGDPYVTKILSMIKRAYPALKNMLCYHGIMDPDEHLDWAKLIDIWCFQISHYNKDKVDKLKKAGIEVWMYVSGSSSDTAPNLGLDFDSVEYRIIPWLHWKLEIPGFLYWCVNWWEEADPFETGATTRWEQNGNGVLFYPGQEGPVASYRAEIFRDGMEDYEYLALLKKQVHLIERLKMDGSYDGLLKKARKYLNIQDNFVKNVFEYSRDKNKLRKYRNDLADIISEINAIQVP